MYPAWFCPFQLKFCFLKDLERDWGTDSPFPSSAESKQQFLKRHRANLPSWLLPLMCLTWPLAPLPVSFCFVNLWALEFLVSCCSFSLQMPVYYYPSGQYPTSTTQQYRPIASVQYNAQRSQQIPQTAQQAGIYICYFLRCSKCLCWWNLVAGLSFRMWTVGGESWLLLCLKTRCQLQIEKPTAWRCWAVDERMLHPLPLLSCTQCHVLGVCAPRDGAQRELGGIWCEKSHCMFKPTVAVCPSSCKLPKHFWDHLLLSLSLRSDELVHTVGACWNQLPAVMCGWKGGRYTVREWVAGLTVNRSLFLLCHATTPDDARVRGL